MMRVVDFGSTYWTGFPLSVHPFFILLLIFSSCIRANLMALDRVRGFNIWKLKPISSQSPPMKQLIMNGSCKSSVRLASSSKCVWYCSTDEDFLTLASSAVGYSYWLGPNHLSKD